tara:strand:- start:38195 stop:39532 length:1338 start_codon:yes stop_codon:yes gene_type:complete
MLLFSGFALLYAQNLTKILNTQPNLILILADDLVYKDVGFNGCLNIPTPNIDKIASQGVKFTNAYVSYPVCGPSRAGLITGRYQDRFGFGRNPLFAPNDPNMGLPLSEETLASVLKKANYKSVALGKWHLGAHKSLHPLERGFSDFYGFLSGGHEYFPEKFLLEDAYQCKDQFDGYRTKLLRDYDRIEETEYLTDALSREAVDYIDKYKDQPFFLYVAYNAPHTPLQATDKYLKRFSNIKNKKRKTYAAMVSGLDDGVGRVLDKLEQLELSENTIICFLSDNDGHEKRNNSNNGHLRGGKSDLFEGGIRVPMLVKWKSKIKKGTRSNHISAFWDVLPTVAEILNVEMLSNIDGISFLPSLLKKSHQQRHDYLYWEFHELNGRQAIRKDNWKLVKYNVKTESNYFLFDLNTDPSEIKNISKEHPEKLKELISMLENTRTASKDFKF